MGEELIARTAALLEPLESGGWRFRELPSFLAEQLDRLQESDKRRVVGRLTAFAHFLATHEKAPEASRTLMTVLERAVLGRRQGGR